MSDDANTRLRYGFECKECDRRWYYDRHCCPNCGSTRFGDWRLGTGELVASTISRVTPPNVRDKNRLGLAEFDDVHVIAQLPADEESPAIGDIVELKGSFTLRDDRDETTVGPCLVPADGIDSTGETHS